jgi:hypothetical protein
VHYSALLLPISTSLIYPNLSNVQLQLKSVSVETGNTNWTTALWHCQITCCASQNKRRLNKILLRLLVFIPIRFYIIILSRGYGYTPIVKSLNINKNAYWVQNHCNMCTNAMSLAYYSWHTCNVQQLASVYAIHSYSYIPTTGSSSVGVVAEYEIKYGSLILDREKICFFPH